MGTTTSKSASGASQGGQASAGEAARRFEAIRDRFESVEEVQSELRKAGLEASELILAIDLTKSNEISGQNSFNGVPPLAAASTDMYRAEASEQHVRTRCGCVVQDNACIPQRVV